jgi:hypothetical protein
VTVGGPRLGFFIVLRRQPDPENAGSSFSIFDNLFDLRSGDLANACEKCPLVRPRNKGAIQEDCIVLLARRSLERQRNEVPKASVRHRVLIREQSVVRIEADVRPPFHGLGEDMRSQSSRERGRNGLFEEKPNVRASAGARPFECGREIEVVTRFEKRRSILAPAGLVEIDG